MYILPPESTVTELGIVRGPSREALALALTYPQHSERNVVTFTTVNRRTLRTDTHLREVIGHYRVAVHTLTQYDASGLSFVVRGHCAELGREISLIYTLESPETGPSGVFTLT